MAKMESFIAFVKEQVLFQERMANKFSDDEYRRGLHMKTGNRFQELLQYLQELESRGSAVYNSNNRSTSAQKRILLTFEEVEGLPAELIKELNMNEADMQELVIEHIIAQSGGVLSLDKIMIELYKRTKEIPKRNATVSRLYRMAARGAVFNVPGKKGVYSTYELSDQDAKRMFGQTDLEPEGSQLGLEVAGKIKTS